MGGWKDFVHPQFKAQVVGDTGAEARSIQIPRGIYSSLYIRLSGTGGSGTVAIDTDPTLITRVRVKKSGNLIVDATGTQLRAVARHKQGTIPTVSENTSAYSELIVPIFFGRKLKDKAAMLVADENTRLEMDFGTLVASTAFATGTITISITGVQWIGSIPGAYRGCMTFIEVEDKATGTGRAVYDLIEGRKLASLMIEVATITTVTTVSLSAKSGEPVFMQTEWRDVLNASNFTNDVETAETTLGFIDFYGNDPEIEDLPSLAAIPDPVLVIERGATTTVTAVVQSDIV
jgi:hypothetical protein